jgi:L-serine dehydratase
LKIRFAAKLVRKGSPMSYITTSLFSLFKIGPGPSSSHTIGPMTAGRLFTEVCAELPREILYRAERVRVRLFGSLSATGEGHGTDVAILAGLMGTRPEACPVGLLQRLRDESGTEYQISIGEKPVLVSLASVVHDAIVHNYPYSNTLVAELLDAPARSFSLALIIP